MKALSASPATGWLAVMLGVLISASAGVEAASWTLIEQAHPDQPGDVVDILRDGQPLARFVHGDGQLKPYLHLYGSEGELLTKGGNDGTFPHHRGIFIGWDRIQAGGQVSDLWHLDDGSSQRVAAIELLASDADSATLRARIEWRGRDSGGNRLLVTEWRTMKVSRPSPGRTRVDVHFKLRAEEALTLGGDLQHAGIHFRAAEEVVSRSGEASYFESPDGAVTGPPLDWCKLLMPRGARWYSVLQMNSPANPVDELSQRGYGRFGYFFSRSLPADGFVALNYRFEIREETGLSAPPAIDGGEQAALTADADGVFATFTADLDTDPDGDGLTTAEETLGGSDPYDPASVPVNRPRDPWVFRTIMENRTRMLVAALDEELWLSFNPANCAIDRVWSGGMSFRGKVHPDFSQKNSWIGGTLYHRAPGVVFEATDESQIPVGWTVESGTLTSDVPQSLSDGQRYISALRDARINRLWRAGSNPTVLVSPEFDLSGIDAPVLFSEQRRNSGSNWNVPGAGAIKVEVSENGGTDWSSQVFYSTNPSLSPNQSNYKELLSRSPRTMLRLSIRSADFANLILEGNARMWTAADGSGTVPLTTDWLGYRTLNRREALVLRYALNLEGGASVAVTESPEAIESRGTVPNLRRTFTLTGIPPDTTASLRLGKDGRWSGAAESFTASGSATLRESGGTTYADFTHDGSAEIVTRWNP